MYVYVGFKTFFYVLRHLDSIASYLPTGLHLRFFRSWPSLFLPSSFSSVFLMLSFVLASTSMLFWQSSFCHALNMAIPCELVLFNLFYNCFLQSHLLSYSYISNSIFSPASSNHSFFPPCLNSWTALLAKISITLHVTVHLLQIKLLCCSTVYCAGVMPFRYHWNFHCSCCAIFYHCFCFYMLSSWVSCCFCKPCCDILCLRHVHIFRSTKKKT